MLQFNGKNYYKEKEVSCRYGLSIYWFQKARYTGKTPKYYKLNGQVYYTIEDVDEWMLQNMMRCG